MKVDLRKMKYHEMIYKVIIVSYVESLFSNFYIHRVSSIQWT